MGMMKRMLDDEQITGGETADIQKTPTTLPVALPPAPLAEDQEQSALARMLAEAAWSPLFDVTQRGCFRLNTDEEGKVTREFFCSPIWPYAMARDADGKGWSLAVIVIDRDERFHDVLISQADLAGDFRPVLSRLMDCGLRLASMANAKLILRDFLMGAEPHLRIRHVEAPGWHGNSYLYGSTIIGETVNEILRLKEGVASNPRLKSGGTWEGWLALAELMVGNSRLAFATSTALCAPLMALLQMESGGFHLYGGSSTGKSTAALVAGAAVGGGTSKGFVSEWRTTANGLEGMLAAANDSLLIVDELGQVNPRELGAMVYQAANGQGKARARTDGSLRQPKQWRVAMLSCGELQIGERIREGGDTVRAGMELRIADVPADAGTGMGVFEDIHGFESPEAFARHLKGEALTHYGHAAPAFIEGVITNRDWVVQYVEDAMRYFADNFVPADSNGQVSRVGNRFAMAAAAGTLAAAWGIVPWPEDEALNAAATCFAAWLEQRGGTEAGEILRGVEQVMDFLATEATSKFSIITRSPGIGAHIVEDAKSICGWREKNKQGVWEYFATSKGFKEMCKGFSTRQIAAALAEKGILVRDRNHGTDYTTKNIPGYKAQKVYHLCPNADEQDAS